MIYIPWTLNDLFKENKKGGKQLTHVNLFTTIDICKGEVTGHLS